MNFKILLSCLLLSYGGLAACSQSDEKSKHQSATSQAQLEQPAKQELPSLTDIFGSSVKLQRDRSPNHYSGDFNGDGKLDTLYVVSTQGAVNQLPADVKLVRPWPLNDGVSIKNDLTSGAHNSLAIVLGGMKGGVLLYDSNPISILDTEAAQSITVVKKSDVASLEEPELAKKAKGDIIVVPTEAGIDTYVYWDGSTYKSYSGQDVP